MRFILSLTAVLLLFPSQNTAAQQALPIEAGSRIRISAPALGVDNLVGTSIETDASRLSVQVDEQAGPMTISMSDVTRLEVSQGKRSRVGKGALWGLIIGAGSGAVAGVVAGRDGCFDEGNTCPGTMALIGAGIFGALGTGIGAGIGAFIKTDRWEEVPLDRMQLTLVPTSDGKLAVGLSVAF